MDVSGARGGLTTDPGVELSKRRAGDIGQIASDPPLGGLPGAIWRFEVFFKGFLPI